MVEDGRRLKRPVGVVLFTILAMIVGLVSGLGAVVFRGLIGLFHNLLFLGQFSFFYNADVHTPPSPWGPLVILAPVVAAAVVAFLVKNFAPEAKGHGVPEVLEAIYFQKGVIRPVVAVVKSIASALSIGSGGSAGREGPMIQIGASFGSTLGQWLPMPPWQRITLVAAGAGGGIAASFNTPVGGILFAVEIVMHELSVRTLVPVAVATVSATYVSRLVFGAHPSFIVPRLEIPDFHVMHAWVLFLYVGLGIVTGLASALFIKSLYGVEDYFEERMPGNYYVRHMAAMALVGVMMYLMMVAFGQYYIEGVGYATVQQILDGTLVFVPLLALLFVLKIVATSLTLGSGASGGIFSPAFFMGATLGGGYGVVMAWLLPALSISPPAFAIAGMAGVVGGATGAAMAAVVMIFEMTRDYNVIIPITITVAISYGVRRMLSNESIYTLKVARRGHWVPSAMHADVNQIQRVQDIMRACRAALPAATTRREFADIVSQHPEQSHFLVHQDEQVVGVVGRDASLGALPPDSLEGTLGQIANSRFVVVSGQTMLADLLAKMHADGVSTALVTTGADTAALANVQGIVTDHETAAAMIRSVDLFAD